MNRVLVIRELVAIQVDDCDVAEHFRHVIWEPRDVVVLEVELFEVLELGDEWHQIVLY